MTVYFHGSFGLNREYMAGVLASSLANTRATADEIAIPFGYKAPFTGRYRSWLHKTGLTTKNRKITLTPIGEVVWRNDPKLRSIITQWLMHHELCTDKERAEAWHFFAKEFLPAHREFTTDDLEDGLAMKLMSHHPTHFGRGSSMIKVISRKIIQCYTEMAALGALGIVAVGKKGGFKRGRARTRGSWKSAQSLTKAFNPPK